MPPLRAPRRPRSINLPPRRGTVATETDVLVVGGGPSGVAAAVGAAGAGARVVLVERYGFLGGNATAALVMPLMSFHAHRDHIPRLDVATLFPSDQGPGNAVVAGVFQSFISRLIAAGGALQPSEHTGF